MKYMFVSSSCDLFLNNCTTIIKNNLDKIQFEEGALFVWINNNLFS